MRQWLSRVVPLLGDKNADVRRRASEAVETVYRLVDAGAVAAYAAHATGAEMVSTVVAQTITQRIGEHLVGQSVTAPLDHIACHVRIAVRWSSHSFLPI